MIHIRLVAISIPASQKSGRCKGLPSTKPTVLCWYSSWTVSHFSDRTSASNCEYTIRKDHSSLYALFKRFINTGENGYQMSAWIYNTL